MRWRVTLRSSTWNSRSGVLTIHLHLPGPNFSSNSLWCSFGPLASLAKCTKTWDSGTSRVSSSAAITWDFCPYRRRMDAEGQKKGLEGRPLLTKITAGSSESESLDSVSLDGKPSDSRSFWLVDKQKPKPNQSKNHTTMTNNQGIPFSPARAFSQLSKISP